MAGGHAKVKKKTEVTRVKRVRRSMTRRFCEVMTTGSKPRATVSQSRDTKKVSHNKINIRPRAIKRVETTETPWTKSAGHFGKERVGTTETPWATSAGHVGKENVSVKNLMSVGHKRNLTDPDKIRDNKGRTGHLEQVTILLLIVYCYSYLGL